MHTLHAVPRLILNSWETRNRLAMLKADGGNAGRRCEADELAYRVAARIGNPDIARSIHRYAVRGVQICAVRIEIQTVATLRRTSGKQLA